MTLTPSLYSMCKAIVPHISEAVKGNVEIFLGNVLCEVVGKGVDRGTMWGYCVWSVGEIQLINLNYASWILAVSHVLYSL